jgi:hypothetical protein
MRSLVSFLALLAVLLTVTAAEARGGRDSNDCPPGSTDPDCTTAPPPPPGK